MVITSDIEFPAANKLVANEVNVSSATLMAAAPYLGKYCEAINNEYMLCRFEHVDDPRPCVDFGRKVTNCTMEFFQKMKRFCLHEHEQYANCIDKSSTNYKPWFCRKTHKVYKKCVSAQLSVEYPGFGYFTRARIHTSKCTEPPEEKGPCFPRKDHEPTDELPDCKKTGPARFTGRSYWMTE